MIVYFKARIITNEKGVKVRLDPRTEEEALQDLVLFHETHGRTPTYNDFKKSCAFGDSYPSSTMCRHFGCTWNELLKKVGLTSNHTPTKRDKSAMLQNIRVYYEIVKRPITSGDFSDNPHITHSASTYNRTFGTIAEACKLAEVPHLDDDNYLLHIICKFYIEFGRYPSANRDFRKAGSYHSNPTPQVYKLRFGSWSNAINLAKARITAETNHDHFDT